MPLDTRQTHEPSEATGWDCEARNTSGFHRISFRKPPTKNSFETRKSSLKDDDVDESLRIGKSENSDA